MKASQKILRSLLNYLKESGIQFSRVSSDKMNDRAVAEFSFDLQNPPCILCGPFQDKTKEIISIAHEAGHVMIYRKMNREQVRAYLCAMFAAHGIGLAGISPAGQKFILLVEAEASAKGSAILKEVGVTHEDLVTVKKLMARWYATYERLCRKDVVIKMREKNLNNEDTAFVVSPST